MMAAQSEHRHPGTGATSFLFTEYQYVGVFMVAFAILIFLFLSSVEGFSTKSQPCTYSKDKTCKSALVNAIFSTVSFLLGTITSVVSGFLGMKIATCVDARTTLEARKGVGKAVITAFRSAAIEKGFAIGSAALVSLALLVAFVSRASISTIGDKLKLQFAHMNLEDKVRFEGAGSDGMRELWHPGWRTYSRHVRIVRS